MLTVGTVLADRYELISKVGAGGMSDVYKAKDYVLGRNVAIKVLKQEFSEDRNFVSKFRMEAQSAAGLEHPNIVNIYDVGNEDGMHYIVMEYVEGITLKTYIEKKGQLAFKEAVSIAIQVARGIEAAHNKDIIHRDIKPQNIIISTEGKVKVTDFGIARAASANTISSDVMGSVHYSSPEQARNGFVDERSDIYSLGIVMYEMITGRVPFDGETTVAVAIQHLQEEMPRPSKFAPDMAKSFEQIIFKCTQKSPERRYQTIGDLLSDLRRSLSEPDGDFVVIVPVVDNARTKVLAASEIQEIREHRGIPAEPEDKDLEIMDMQDGEEIPDAPEVDGEDEEDDDDLINPKLDRAMTIMGITTFIVILILLLYLFGSIFGVFRFGSSSGKKTDDTGTESQVTESEKNTQSDVETVTMIDIRRENYKEAEQTIKSMGLQFKVVAFVKANQEDGTIVTQSIAEGEAVELGTLIEVTVAGSGEDSTVVNVPSVVGYNENNAASAITDAKLTYSKSYSYSDSVPAGTVISQSPESGQVDEGTTIKLVISQGKEAVTVPYVIGNEENTAKNTLNNSGLNVVVKSAYSEGIGEGKVVSQSPTSGKTVEKGTTVTIVVSLGPEPQEKEEKPSETPGTSEGSSESGSTGDNGSSENSGSAGGDSGSSENSGSTGGDSGSTDGGNTGSGDSGDTGSGEEGSTTAETGGQ